MSDDKDSIILIGGGGHALSVAASIDSSGRYRVVGYTDKEDVDNGIAYLGTDDVLETLYKNRILEQDRKQWLAQCDSIEESNEAIRCAAVGIGFLGKGRIRDNLYNRLKKVGYELPCIIDTRATVADDSIIKEGTFVGKNAVVNAGAKIGKMCIINTGSIVEHRCVIGDFSHVAVGTVVCGDAQIGDHTLIGANATVIQEVKIGSNCIVGAGSVVLADVPDGMTVYGKWGGVKPSNKAYLSHFSLLLDSEVA